MTPHICCFFSPNLFLAPRGIVSLPLKISIVTSTFRFFNSKKVFIFELKNPYDTCFLICEQVQCWTKCITSFLAACKCWKPIQAVWCWHSVPHNRPLHSPLLTVAGITASLWCATSQYLKTLETPTKLSPTLDFRSLVCNVFAGTSIDLMPQYFFLHSQ